MNYFNSKLLHEWSNGFKTVPMRLLPLSTPMPFFILLLLFFNFLNLVYTQMAGQDKTTLSLSGPAFGTLMGGAVW